MAAKLKDSILFKERDIQPCHKEIEVTIPEEAIKREGKIVLQQVSYEVQLPGFRKGRAPEALLRLKYQNVIRDELIKRIKDAIDEKLKSIEAYSVITRNMNDAELSRNFTMDAELKHTINVDIEPEIVLGDYKSIEVDIPIDPVTDEMLEKQLDSYRSYAATREEVEGPACPGDTVVVSYKSDVELPEDASPMEKRYASANHTFIQLTEPEMIPGIIKVLNGANKGKISFETEYSQDAIGIFSGKKVKYELELEEIHRPIPLSDEKLINLLHRKTMDECRDMIRRQLEDESQKKHTIAVNEAIMERLDDMVPPFALPPMQKQEVLEKRIAGQIGVYRHDGLDADAAKERVTATKEQIKKDSDHYMRMCYILDRIAKLEKIGASREEIIQACYLTAKENGLSSKDIRKLFKEDNYIEWVLANVTRQKVLAFISKNTSK